MDVTLGPWTAEQSVEEKDRKPLIDAMADAARNAVRVATGFTGKDATLGKPAKTGFTISGKITHVVREGGSVTVRATFTLWVDSTFSNVAPLKGEATASGSMGAADAVQAFTEARVKKLLDAIRSGQAKKAR
jgi:hypothetical protein